MDELVVVVVVVVGPWYCAGTSLLDELDIVELEIIELETIELDIIELETIELDIAEETELEIEDTLLDTPGYTGGPANLTAVVIFPAE